MAIYAVCRGCGKIINVSKRLLGSLHICTTEEERTKYADQIRERVEASQRILDQNLKSNSR